MLEKIKNVTDLKKLSVAELPALCEEIRNKLLSDVKHNGGHLASNLGVVELTVALHYVFDEGDKIVWDVGHQSYVHKILTGRGDVFTSLRQQGGISGFPDCDESEFDCFNTGHAGTAISAALGLAKARDLQGQKHKVIAVVGDGSMTCGLSFEGLNNIDNTDMLVVFNDNNMSISQSVGSATLNMSKMRVGNYDKRKQRIKNFLLHIPLLGKPVYNFLRWCKRKAKSHYAKNSYFDNFNLKYVGVIDGNEIKDLVYYLTKIRDNVHKPTLLHVITRKGKGYKPAEDSPEEFHSYSPYRKGDVTSSAVVGDTLCNIADNANIAVVCAAMSLGLGFDGFSQKYPERFYDVGIAEGHAVTFSAGLAKGGVHPFVGIYSTFLQRSYDQILHDVAIQNLPVTLLVEHGGFVGDDGKTHQGLFDLSYLSQIPNLAIWTPSTYSQLAKMITISAYAGFPIAIRYPNVLSDEERDFGGRWNVVKHGGRVKLLAVGPRMLANAVVVAEKFDVEVVDVTTVKPLDVGYLRCVADGSTVITLEENVLNGGFGSLVTAFFADRCCVTVKTFGVDDKFVKHATVNEQLVENNLDAESICKFVGELYSNC